MYSNFISDPIDCDREAYEAEEGFGQLLITSANSSVASDTAKEIFHGMTVSIECAVEVKSRATGSSRRNADGRAGVGKILSEIFGVESAITNNPATAEHWEQRFAGAQVVLGPGREMKTVRAPDAVNHGGEFGVKSALGPTDRLGGLASHRIGPILMNLNVGAVDAADPTTGIAAKGRDQTGPEPRSTPSSEARVDGALRAKPRWKIPPRHAGA